MPKRPKSSVPPPLAEQALAKLARKHKLKQPLLTDHRQVTSPETGLSIHQFTAAASADANGPRYRILLDDGGKAVDETPALLALFDLARDVGAPVRLDPAPRPLTGPASVRPDRNDLTLGLGGGFEETITVTIPAKAGIPKADIYFLADTTGSMADILNGVQIGAGTILAALNGLAADLAFGVGNYKDLPNDRHAFQHQLDPTATAADVAAAINHWTADGGGDAPEGQLFALDALAVPPGPGIGWRTGAKRIIVWFGDAPGHDPICAAISGAAADISEASVTAKLRREEIAVLAISTAIPGLDGDPTAGAGDYDPACGTPGGSAGQATRLAAATGGAFATGINPGNIANTIVALVRAAVGTIQQVTLVPSPSIAPFVASIAPAGGHGPLPADRDHTLAFRVKFTGTIPCKPDPQVFGGSLDVVADRQRIAGKPVRITVQACRPKSFVYAAKFLCGLQSDDPCACAPTRPGTYATEINIHNGSAREVVIRTRAIPLVLASAPVGREPAARGANAEDRITLPPHSATLVDCCRLAESMPGATHDRALTIGILEITASDDVAVTVVHTANGLDCDGTSIDVRQVRGRRL